MNGRGFDTEVCAATAFWARALDAGRVGSGRRVGGNQGDSIGVFSLGGEQRGFVICLAREKVVVGTVDLHAAGIVGLDTNRAGIGGYHRDIGATVADYGRGNDQN